MSVDKPYIKKNLERILRDLEQYNAEELSRALLRLAKVSDHRVFDEDEFTTKTSVKVTKLEQENKELRDYTTGLALNAKQQLEKEAKGFVGLSNDMVEKGVLGEGSIVSESAYVETRILDIEDPLFGSIPERLAQHDKEVTKEFVDFVKSSEHLTHIEKITVHALWVKFTQLKEQ